MTQRNIDSGYWSDPDIQPLPLEVKALYLYSFTNDHCNPAGLYRISLETVAFEIGATVDRVKPWVAILECAGKLTYHPNGLLWVKGFLRRQSRSPKFLEAAAKCLRELDRQFPDTVREYIKHNDTLSIPYRYPISTVSEKATQAQSGYPIDTLSIPSAQDQIRSDQPSTAQISPGEPPTPLPPVDEKLIRAYALWENNMGPLGSIVSQKIADVIQEYGLPAFESAVERTVGQKGKGAPWAYFVKVLSNHNEVKPRAKAPPDARELLRQEKENARTG